MVRISSLKRRMSPEQDNQDSQDKLGQLMRIIAATRPEELDCDECLELVDGFAEEMFAGKDAAEAMPLVEGHLELCPYCREEFEALLAALRAQHSEQQ